MRRKSMANDDPAKKALWLITFSDLSTLLLALFVMLFSMSSIDSGMVERISSAMRDSFPYANTGKGKADSRMELALRLLSDVRQIRENEHIIKELLFPEDLLPPELDAGILRRQVRIAAVPEGASIVLNEDALFKESSATLTPQAVKVLSVLTPLLHLADQDILVTGHTDADNTVTGDNGDEAARALGTLRYRYNLSADRALAVLEFFIRTGVERGRFSASGYGADRPMLVPLPGRKADATQKAGAAEGSAGEASSLPELAEGRSMNRRVEIILKNKGGGFYN